MDYEIVSMGADEATMEALREVTPAIYIADGPSDAARVLSDCPRAVAVYGVGCWGQLVTHHDMAPFHTLLGADRQGWVVTPDMDRVDEAKPYDDPYWLFYQVMARWSHKGGDGQPMITGALNLSFGTARAVLAGSISREVASDG